MHKLLTASISASAVEKNLGLLRDCMAPATRLCAVIKADAYGHGADLLFRLIANKADMLAVATPEEAVQLRAWGYHAPLLLLQTPFGFGDDKERSEVTTELIQQRITLSVVSPQELDMISAIASPLNIAAEIHVMIDTGMQRSGVSADKAQRLIQNGLQKPGIALKGIYTHFANADAEDKSFTQQQIATFKRALTPIDTHGMLLHAANSAATIDLKDSHFDMVRPGISIYGYQASDEMHHRLPLQPALRLTARLAQTKHVQRGTSCGYGLTYTFDKPGRLGLVPMGYGDGYPRCVSNRAVVGIGRNYAPIRGRVSMGMLIVDLTDIPNAAPGDEVEIISPDPQAPNSVEALARLADTIPYEITCRLSSRISRVLVD